MQAVGELRGRRASTGHEHGHELNVDQARQGQRALQLADHLLHGAERRLPELVLRCRGVVRLGVLDDEARELGTDENRVGDLGVEERQRGVGHRVGLQGAQHEDQLSQPAEQVGAGDVLQDREVVVAGACREWQLRGRAGQIRHPDRDGRDGGGAGDEGTGQPEGAGEEAAGVHPGVLVARQQQLRCQHCAVVGLLVEREATVSARVGPVVGECQREDLLQGQGAARRDGHGADS